MEVVLSAVPKVYFRLKVLQHFFCYSKREISLSKWATNLNLSFITMKNGKHTIRCVWQLFIILHVRINFCRNNGQITQRKKCRYSVFLGLNKEIVFSSNARKYGPEKSEYGQFSRSVKSHEMHKIYPTGAKHSWTYIKRLK